MGTTKATAIASEEIEERINAMAAEAGNRCGQSHDVYVQLFSGAVDRAFPEGMPQRAEALAFAKSYDYMTPEELEREATEMREAGYCSHGLDPDCCPCGCGDIDDSLHEPDDFEIDPRDVYYTISEALSLIVSKLEGYDDRSGHEKEDARHEIFNVAEDASAGNLGSDEERMALKEILDLIPLDLENAEDFPDDRILAVARRGLVPDDTCECQYPRPRIR